MLIYYRTKGEFKALLEGLTKTGKMFYPSGALRFDGEYIPDFVAVSEFPEQYLQGRLYYEDGTLHKEGVFQRAGLRRGRQYYTNGQLKFEGFYNFREPGNYFWPAYPVEGKLYDEEGNLLCDGKIPVRHYGGAAYLKR